MEAFNVMTWAICLVAIFPVNSSPIPGYHQHVHHRIYVPTKIKTIHHTKIIKVPEHHHYFHEKEKIIQVETPHHKGNPKTSFRDLEVKLPSIEHDDSLDDFSEHHSGGHYYGGERHNIFKKHAIIPEGHKMNSAERKKDEEEDEYEDEEDDE